MEKEQKKHEEVSEEPPSYAAVSATTPLGLEQLNFVNRFDVRQTDITTEHGEVIFYLKRELVSKGCSTYTLRFDLYDRIGQQVISIVPETSFCKQRLKFIVNEDLSSTLSQSCALFASYVITDDKYKTVYKVQYPKKLEMGTIIFRVKDLNGELVGTFTKKPRRLVDQLFSDANEFAVSFTKPIDIRYKTAVMCICCAFIQNANFQLGMGS